MKIGAVIGLPVIAMKEGSKLGHIVDAVIDADSCTVSHYLIGRDSKYDLLIVETSVVAGIGSDYMVIRDAGDIRRIFGDPKRMEIVSRGFYLSDAAALSPTGSSLGTVADFELNPQTGAVESLVLENGEEFPASSIVAMSGNTVFIDQDGGAARTLRRLQPAPQPEPIPEAATPAALAPQQESGGRRKRKEKGGARKITQNPVPIQAQRAYQSSAADSFRPLTDTPQMPGKAAAQTTPPEAPSAAMKINYRKMLIGKKMAQDVISDDGIFKANEGDTITEWMVQLAEQHDALPLLMRYVEPS